LTDSFANQVFSGDVLVGEDGSYVAVFDPMDGSSNVDAGIAVGTIFGILHNIDGCVLDENDALALRFRT
jgi:fructose-1,6-bisphosphatase